MDRPVMLGVDDVAERLNVSKSYAYQVIREMNKEQIKLGRAVMKGRVRSDHFEQRFFAGGDDARL